MEKKPNPSEFKLDSLVVHGNMGHDSHANAVSFPIYQTATYINKNFGGPIDFSYSRCANPTRDELEKPSRFWRAESTVLLSRADLPPKPRFFPCCPRAITL